MKTIDIGTGVPVVLIPGVQGRWEWMAPSVRAIGKRARILTFSLADEPSSGARFDPTLGLRGYVDQAREALDAAGLARATICGTSFGGLIAAAFAAVHPERVSALVLISALSQSWTPDARARFFMQAPRLLSPLFCLASLRLYPEIAAAHGGPVAALAPALRHLWNVVTHPFSPRLMARRLRMMGDPALAQAIAGVRVPTLVIMGEPGLDRVVPPEAAAEYLRLWPHAESATLTHTGHIGHVTRPTALGDLIVPFAERAADATPRRHVG